MTASLTCRVGPDSERLVRTSLSRGRALQSFLYDCGEPLLEVDSSAALTTAVARTNKGSGLLCHSLNRRQCVAQCDEKGSNHLAGGQSSVILLIEYGEKIIHGGIRLT